MTATLQQSQGKQRHAGSVSAAEAGIDEQPRLVGLAFGLLERITFGDEFPAAVLGNAQGAAQGAQEVTAAMDEVIDGSPQPQRRVCKHHGEALTVASTGLGIAHLAKQVTLRSELCALTDLLLQVTHVLSPFSRGSASSSTPSEGTRGLTRASST